MQIALIGAGPRNLILTERLVTFANQSDKPVTITLFDPAPIGGRVWSPEQNPFFVANTIASHATLFSDDTIPTLYPGLTGPNWYEWLKTFASDFIQQRHYTHQDHFLQTIDHLTPNTYPSRALMGVYAAWVFEQIQTYAHANVHIEHTTTTVTQIRNVKKQFELTLADAKTALFDHVILTPGHLPNEPTPEEQLFATSGLTYLPVGHPSEAKLALLPAQEMVILRGLGLSFFDYMAALTLGRGGTFTEQTNGQLIYTPSGKEPYIIAGSRHGELAHARGINQKPAHVSYTPKIFTPERLLKTQPTDFDTFFQLIRAEMELVYYQNLLADQPDIYSGDVAEFIASLITSDDLTQTVAASNLPVQYQYDWSRVYPHTTLADTDAMHALLTTDILDGQLGNAHGPYSGSYEIVKDLRSLIRHYLYAGIFDGTGYASFLDVFGPFNNTVAVGPPLDRMKELQALITAGIVTITNPGLKVTVQDTHYYAEDNVGNNWQADYLVEARLPTPNLAKVTDPLMTQLIQDKYVQDVTMTRTDGSTYQIPAVDVNARTLQVENKAGQLDNLFIWGIPTEGGKRWFTTFLPRPNDHDSNMVDAETITQIIFS